jgi:S1-C subfamily serine protease
MLSLLLLLSPISFAVENETVVNEDNERTVFRNALIKANEASVSIYSISSVTGYSRCTGTLIKNYIDKIVVLTAKHCVDNMAEEIYVDGVLVKNIVIDAKKDLALLYLSSPIQDKKPVVISDKDVIRGDIIFIFAYPTDEPYIQPGMVTVKSFNNYYAYLKVIGGCSGGAVFNRSGELVGVVWGSLRGQDVGIFTSLSNVNRFLKENNL